MRPFNVPPPSCFVRSQTQPHHHQQQTASSLEEIMRNVYLTRIQPALTRKS